MKQLTTEAQQIIDTLAQRYQFSSDAVLSLWQAIRNGNGSMAQFNHPEFGGSGQWMQNGMIMTADMFIWVNNPLLPYTLFRGNHLCKSNAPYKP